MSLAQKMSFQSNLPSTSTIGGGAADRNLMPPPRAPPKKSAGSSSSGTAPSSSSSTATLETMRTEDRPAIGKRRKGGRSKVIIFSK